MDRLAIVGGLLIDGTGKAPISEAVVLITGERIANVFRRGEIDLPKDARVIEASGKTILPGIIESHGHVGNLMDDTLIKVDDYLALTSLFMKEFIEHGITTVRDTGNFDPGEIFHVLKRGRGDWPRHFGAAVILDGPADPPAPWKWLKVVDDADEARKEVAKLIQAGVDFVKIYAWMKAHVLRAVVEEAHFQGLKVAAHVGHVLTVKEAVRIGVDALEHVRVGREIMNQGDLVTLKALPPRALDPLVSWRPWRFIDPSSEQADRLIDFMAERGVFFTPTLTLARAILKGDVPEVIEPPGIEKMPKTLRNWWKEFAYPSDYTREDFKHAKVELARQMVFVGRAQKGGVKVVAGSDTPNPFVLPGSSLHDELQLLVESGLTPMEALVAATGRASELLGQQNDLGTVAKGRYGDILILDGNPLENIQNIRRVRTVLKSGQVVYSTPGALSKTA